MTMGREWSGFDAVALQTVTGQSVREFAGRLGVDPKTVTNWRARGRAVQLRPFTKQLLDIALARASEVEQAQFLRMVTSSAVIDSTHTDAGTTSGALNGLTAIEYALPRPDDTGEPTIRTPAGRFFAGVVTPVAVLPADISSGRVLVATDDLACNPMVRRPQRGMVVAAVNTAEGSTFYGLDRRLVLSRLAVSNPRAPLMIPRAYRLDEFTLAITWAVTNLDDALLDDDAELAAAALRLAMLDIGSRSVAAPDLAGELSQVSQMWLGSDFCARHIRRHADQLTDIPAFWTREQRGEEASTWLLFAHKYQYLQHTAGIFASKGRTVTRAFCIPPEAVSASWQPERVLMLLTASLIESFGIQIAVCVEPEYTATQGFVLDQNRRAIIATWSNTDRIWEVDVTDHRPTLGEFSDASGWACNHSILTAATPHQRLQALADYLQLDWTWLVRRATDFADYGIAGFTKPRNRLLSLAGLDRACRFLADCPRPDR